MGELYDPTDYRVVFFWTFLIYVVILSQISTTVED